MSLVVASVFAAQLFLAGISIVHVWAIAGAIIAGSVGAFFSFSHVQARIDRFFDPAQGRLSGRAFHEAFRNGGLFGVGPGEGKVKSLLPDARGFHHGGGRRGVWPPCLLDNFRAVRFVLMQGFPVFYGTKTFSFFWRSRAC